MSYAKLWNNTSLVIKQSADHKVIFEDFITAVSKRIEVEENYASDLTDLSEQLDKHLKKENVERSSMIFVLSALKSDLVRRSTQTVAFANHLKDDVMTVLKEFLDKQLAEAAQMEKQILNLESTYQQQASRMRYSKDQMSEIDKVREEEFIKLQIMKARFFLKKQQQQKQSSRVRKVQKQYQDCELVSKAIIKQYNEFISGFYPQIQKSLGVLQKQEEDRINMMVDNMKKILVFQVSMIRNFEYDVTNITNHLGTLQAHKDIEEFVNRCTKQSPKNTLESPNKLSLINSVILQMLNKTLDERIKFDKNERIRGMISKIHKTEPTEEAKSIFGENYSSFLELSKTVIEVKSGGLSQAHKEKLGPLLDKSENRNYFQLCLRIQVEQDNNQTNQALPSLIQFFIEKCISKKDVFCIRMVLNIIFVQLNLKSIRNKEVLLYGQLINLPVWKNHDFWDACLFQAVQQQLKIHYFKKGEGIQEAKIRQKNIILAQLMSSCYMMIMLSHPLSKVKDLAFKYSKMYNLIQTDYQDLLRIINEGSVTYIETWVLSQKNSTKAQNDSSGSER